MKTPAPIADERLAEIIDGFIDSRPDDALADSVAEKLTMAVELKRLRADASDMKTVSVTISVTSDMPELLDAATTVLQRLKGDAS